MAQVWYRDNSYYIKITGLKNKKDDSFINDAVVTARVQDQDGSDVTGETWPVTMSYIAASDGEYDVTVTSALSLDALKRGRLKLVADKASPLLHSEWVEPLNFEKRPLNA